MESTSHSASKRKTPEEPESSSKRLKSDTVDDIWDKVFKHYSNVNSANHMPLTKLLNNEQIKALCSSIQSKTFILLAVRKKCWNLVNSLVSIGINIDFRDDETGKTLSDMAYEQNQLFSLAKILDADGPYPMTTENGKSTSVQEKVLLKKNKELIAVVKKRINLHECIKRDNRELIKEIIKHNPKLRHGYKAGNRSALTTALEFKRFYLYSFLCSKGFKHGMDPHFDRQMLDLDDKEREDIRNFNQEFYQRHGSVHVYELVNKSYPAFGSECENFADIVSDYYKQLDTMTELQPILKVVAESDEAKIVFDFHSSYVQGMDPTAATKTFGRTYPYGYIYIGAFRDLVDILGTLIHELMHFAMQLVYENGCLPFYKQNSKQINKVKHLVEKYDNIEMKSKNNIIARAFQYDDMETKMAEIVVRPAHLMAVYKDKPDEIAEIRETFEYLFNYFIKISLKDISEVVLSLKKQKKIKMFNLQLGFFERYNMSKIYCDKSKRAFSLTGGQLFIASETPELVVFNLVKYLKDVTEKIDSKYMFTDLETLVDRRFDLPFREIFSSGYKPTLVVVAADKNKFDAKSIQTISSKCGNETNMILISNTGISNNSAATSLVSYIWTDLEDSPLHSSKRELQSTHFKLHKRQTTLNMFMMPDSIEIINEPLVNILKLVQTTDYDEEVPAPFLPFSIEREFKSMVKKRSKILYTEDLAKKVTEDKVIVLADIAGMGKSTSAIEIAKVLKKNSDKWIAFVDLKNHLEKFKKDQDTLGKNVFDAKFFSQHIFKFNSRPELKFLFESMFKGTKVTFIIDGFDEISPRYKGFVLDLLSFIKASKNCLLVTTRVHLRSVLEDHLEVIAVNLLPLEEDDRINFIAKYWASVGKNETNLKVSAKKLLKRIQSSLKGKQKRSDLSQFFGIPMHLYMLADQTRDQLQDIENFNFNVYDLYYKFVSRKLKNCEDKGGLADEDRESLYNFNKFEVYHKIALEHFFEQELIEVLNFRSDITPLCNERISSQGLLHNRDEKLEFLHTSYAEFFVADYILMQLGSSSSNCYGIFFKILINEKFENVRKFLNEGLNPNSQIRKGRTIHKNTLKLYLTEKVNGKNRPGLSNRKLLRLIVSESQNILLKFALDCLDCTQKKKVQILTNKFKKDRTIHLSIAEDGSEIFDLLFDWLGPGLKKNDLEKILTCKGKDNDTIRDRAFAKNNQELIDRIAEKSRVLNLRQRTLFSYFVRIENPRNQ